MAIDTVHVSNYDSILQTITSWPVRQRVNLVQDVLTSLTPEGTTKENRRPTLSLALGLLADDSMPAPTDEEIALILNERRNERFE